MAEALPVALLGLLLGLKHATDADHVAAVTAIVAREGAFGRAARIGALWGVGHSLTVLVIGGALVAFRVTIPARLGLGLEFLVALMLIVIGFVTIRSGTRADGDTDIAASRDGWRPLAIGVVHGLAGSAAVALLVLAVIPQSAWAIAYLVVFGAGTIVGMTVVTWLVATPAAYATRRVAGFQRGLRYAAGAVSLVLGVALARELVVDHGLLRATPTWTAR